MTPDEEFKHVKILHAIVRRKIESFQTKTQKMIPKNFDFWSRDFWLPEGVDWEHIEDYEKEENLKAANVKDLIPVIYLTIGLYFARILFEKSIGKITASLMGIKVRVLGTRGYTSPLGRG